MIYFSIWRHSKEVYLRRLSRPIDKAHYGPSFLRTMYEAVPLHIVGLHSLSRDWAASSAIEDGAWKLHLHGQDSGEYDADVESSQVLDRSIGTAYDDAHSLFFF